MGDFGRSDDPLRFQLFVPAPKALFSHQRKQEMVWRDLSGSMDGSQVDGWMDLSGSMDGSQIDGWTSG